MRHLSSIAPSGVREAGPVIWLAAGVRTPFAKVDGPLGRFDAIGLSVPVARHMIGLLEDARPDFAVWGAVVPNLTWSNIAREIRDDRAPDGEVRPGVLE